MRLIFAAMRQMLYTLLRTAVTGVSLGVLALSCSDLLAGQEDSGENRGMLQWNFASAPLIEAMTRAAGEIPDTNAFLLTVRDASGKTLYDGTYGASPTSLLVEPGSYTVTARSCAFSAPAFSKPLFGDEQVIVVRKNETARAVLTCRQLNAGMRLRVASNFLTAYPASTLHLKSADGSLLYGYRESRIAYFRPGPVSLVMSTSGQGDQTLYTRTLSAPEILTLSVSAATSSASQGGSLSIQLDTARTWLGDSYVIGGENGGGGGGSAGSSIPTAFSVPAAKENIGALFLGHAFRHRRALLRHGQAAVPVRGAPKRRDPHGAQPQGPPREPRPSGFPQGQPRRSLLRPSRPESRHRLRAAVRMGSHPSWKPLLWMTPLNRASHP